MNLWEERQAAHTRRQNMAACPFVIDAPGMVRMGDAFIVRVPGLTHPCRATFSINGQPVNDTGTYSSVRVTGKSASHISLVAEGNTTVNIAVTVACEGECDPDTKTHTILITGLTFWQRIDRWLRANLGKILEAIGKAFRKS